MLKAFPEFKYLGDPILRTPTNHVEFNEGLAIGKKLGIVLLNYRKLTGMGRGLAAPQIGIAKSVFATFVDNEIQVYINPKVVVSSGETNNYRELCLSSGIMWADVERPASIELEWTNSLGEKENKVFDSFIARLLQHEEAHMRGICNLDQAVPGTIEIQLSDPLLEKIRAK